MVIPVYNNASTLPLLCQRLRAALPGRPLELVCVDDGSTDDSLAVLRTLDVRVVEHRRNRGQNAAVRSGLARASLPLTCVIDADLEDPPEALPRLLEGLGTASVAFSSREEMQRMTSSLFRWSVRRLFPTLPAHPCLCFAIDAPGRAALLAAARDRDYLPAVIGALGLTTAQVTVSRGVRPSDGSRGVGLEGPMRWRYAAAMLAASLRIWWRSRARGPSVV